MLGILDFRLALVAQLKVGKLEKVYYARDRAAKRPVLVRELASDFFPESEAFDFFLREYDQIVRLRHRAALEQYSLKRSGDGRVFIISEYIAGVSLRVFLDQLVATGRACPPAVGLYIAGRVGEVLRAAHNLVEKKTGESTSTLHLDICPSSILLSSDGRVKVKGFDLARARIRRGLGDRPGRLVYLPPERIEGAYLDRRSDLYSLGACLYEMVVGTAPFAGTTTVDIRRKITAGVSDYSIQDRPGVPLGLGPILRRAMAPAPNDRYADLGGFLVELKKVASGIEGADSPRNLPRVLRRAIEAKQLGPPTEESAPEIAQITTTTLRSPAGEDAITAERDTLERAGSAAPAAAEEKPEIEPIEALARKGGFEDGPPSRERRRPTVSLALLRTGVIGTAILAIILDFVFGVTPLGRLVHRQTGVEGPVIPQIVSIPNGASIYINDRYVGRTPRSVKRWPEGVTTLRLEYSGFAPAETILVLEKDQLPELSAFVLELTISIRSQPPGADVYINGESISAARAAGYTLRATDTISVEVRKMGMSAPPPLVLSAAGPLGDVDSSRWLIEVQPQQAQFALVGFFSRKVMISSRPYGASIFVDDDTLAIGTTNQALDLPLGKRQITLRRPPFLDYTFEISVTEDSPGRYSPILSRYVRISAVDAESAVEDVGADIRWVRQGERLIKSPDDHLQTPYSLNLAAADHEIMLAKKGYRDTVVVLPAGVSAVTVVMDPEKRAGPAPEPQVFKWVRFLVERSGNAVSGATVIGYEKDRGRQYGFGTTGEEGQLLVKVQPGNFSFVAIRGEERSRVKNARIKQGRKIKSITLKFR